MVSSNTSDDAGRQRMKAFIQAAQRITFDGQHTLTVVFKSLREATIWAGAVFKLRGQSIQLNQIGNHLPGICSPPMLARNYAVRVLGTESVTVVPLIQIMEEIAGVKVLDVRLPGITGPNTPDNDFRTVIFCSMTCPSTLNGVTGIRVGDTELILHHFQRHQSPPCWRCLSPQHLQSRCRVAEARLDQTRAIRQREYTGHFRLSTKPILPDCRDLTTLDRLLQELVEPDVSNSEARPDGGVLRPVRAQSPPAPTTEASLAPPSLPQANAVADGDDMIAVRRRRPRAERRARRSNSQPRASEGAEVTPGRTASPTTALNGAPQGSPNAQHGANTEQQRQPTRHVADSKVARRYRETLDAYRVLAGDSDSDSDVEDNQVDAETTAKAPPRSDSSVHKADRADGHGEPQQAARDTRADSGNPALSQPQDQHLAGDTEDVEMFDSTGLVESDASTRQAAPLSDAEAFQSGSGTVQPIHHHDLVSGQCNSSVDADVEMRDSPHDSLKADPSANMSGKSDAPQDQDLYGDVHSPSSETDPSQEPFWHSASPASPLPRHTDDAMVDTSYQSDHDGDSDGFVLEKVVPPCNAYNLDYREWIGSLHGVQISAPANGQCLFLAFYATTTNTQAKKLSLRSTTVTAADLVKQRVLDIVLANLRYDVKLRLVLPKEELQRIYPGESPPKTIEAAAAMLFAHYTKMRNVSVATPVPQAFWEGPTVLRAMAVYLREPIYVWDIGTDDKAYVQQYSYQTFEMENGDRHETGIVTPLAEDKIRDILEACFHQHVLPTMLLLKHKEGHFYGVQHGETFHEWHAQRGPEMRERLDNVHRLVGLPVLPAAGYEPGSVATEAVYEEQALLEEMGVDFYASGSQDSSASALQIASVKRAQVDPHVDVHRNVYERLLRVPDIKKMGAIDSRLVGRLLRANDAAFKCWTASEGQRFGLPTPDAGQTPWLASLEWLTTSPSAMRHVLAFLPYPELAIQSCTNAQLSCWGEREAYHEQIQTLECIWRDEESDDAARLFCESWVAQCNDASTQTAVEMARDRQRWNGLGKLVDASLLRLRPLEISLEHWFILHVLPYVVRDWEDTAMGRAPACSRALWYMEYRQVQDLCTGVADKRDWSQAMRLPLGPTRTGLTSTASRDAVVESGVASDP